MVLPTDPITIFQFIAYDIGYAAISAVMMGLTFALFSNFNG